jgi:hypothetical protein
VGVTVSKDSIYGPWSKPIEAFPLGTQIRPNSWTTTILLHYTIKMYIFFFLPNFCIGPR